jgi:hypothetical protein
MSVLGQFLLWLTTSDARDCYRPLIEKLMEKYQWTPRQICHELSVVQIHNLFARERDDGVSWAEFVATERAKRKAKAKSDGQTPATEVAPPPGR